VSVSGEGLGIRGPVFGFRVGGFGFRVSGFGFQVSGLGVGVQGLVCTHPGTCSIYIILSNENYYTDALLSLA